MATTTLPTATSTENINNSKEAVITTTSNIISAIDEEQLLRVVPVQNTTAPLPQWQSFVFSSISATIAAPFTNPFAVAKTQLQVQRNDVNGGKPKLRGMVDFFRHVITGGSSSSSGGMAALQRGVVPVMMREASMNLFRIGLYQPIMSQIHNEESSSSPPVWKRMVAGAISGAVGSFICNPFEIIRIKVQAQSLDSSSGTPRVITSNILKEEGMKGFYKAGSTSVVLGMVCTSVNLTSYTLLHEMAIERGYSDGPIVDSICAFASGFCAAVAMNPIDVVRTRLMTQPISAPIYRNAFHCATTIMKTEGWTAFFKGFVPSFLRIGPHFVLTFMLLEQMRRAAQDYNNNNARNEFLCTIFKKIDTDSSGEIDKDELSVAINEIGLSDNATSITDTIFDIADTDNSGTIDLNEFLVAADTSQLYTIIHHQQLLSMFRSFDLNGDGTISESELYEALRGRRFCGGGAKDEKAESTTNCSQLRRDVSRVMKEIDKDGNGSIDFAEFVEAYDHIDDLNQRHVLKDLIRSSGVAL